MARNSSNVRTDKIFGLANDLRNRTRRLLFHANINANEDSKIDHICVDLLTSVATLSNGADFYKDGEAQM